MARHEKAFAITARYNSPGLEILRVGGDGEDVMADKRVDESAVYQLKVTLKGSKPPIWRRLLVRGSTRLSELHAVLQIVMGWTDSHLHQFIVGGEYYGTPDPEWDREVKNERRFQLEQVVSEVKDRFIYEYDFGDDWLHEIVVEKVLTPETGMKYPVCIAGKRACPPDDCGGIWGYSDMLEALADPNHPEHDSLSEWIGGPFDAEAFDLDAINGRLGWRRHGAGHAV